MTPTQQKAYDCIKNNVHSYTTPTDVMKCTGNENRQSVSNILKALVKKGLIKKIDKGRYVTCE